MKMIKFKRNLKLFKSRVNIFSNAYEGHFSHFENKLIKLNAQMSILVELRDILND